MARPSAHLTRLLLATATLACLAGLAACNGAGSTVPAAGGTSPASGATTAPGRASLDPRLVADRLPGEPDPRLTPGALNPDVTEATIHETICVAGWATSVRPSEDYTHDLKIKQIAEYGYADRRLSLYEEDHLIPLSLGGAPSDPRNLWPQPEEAWLPDGRPVGADVKNDLAAILNGAVCSGALSLAAAQDQMLHWVHAYYSIPLPGATPWPTLPLARPTQPYWYCWDLGSPKPHHLGYRADGDHPCSDAELRAADLLP